MSKRGYGSTGRHRPSLTPINNLSDTCIEWITIIKIPSLSLVTLFSGKWLALHESEVWNLTLLTVTKIRWLFKTNRESNVKMDESSVVEDPKLLSSYISSVAEEPLISTWSDEDFSHGKETTRIESVADEMFEFGSTVTSTPAKRKRKAYEHRILQWAKYHSGSCRTECINEGTVPNTRKLPSLET